MPRIRRGDICGGSGRFAVRFGALLVVVDFVGDADMHCVPFTRFLKEVDRYVYYRKILKERKG